MNIRAGPGVSGQRARRRAGKAILAYLPTDERQAVLDEDGRTALTDATLTDAEALADELDSQRLEQEIPGIVVSASRSVENAVQTDSTS